MHVHTHAHTHRLIEEQDSSLYNVLGSTVTPLVMHVSINKVAVEIEVDTEAPVFIISEEIYNHLWSTDINLSSQMLKLTVESRLAKQNSPGQD